ncbi:MAG: glycosyltransferase family 2 protein [Proteobacteria bacterium]|nr:glycosyltransferase family 2 protein [Pseudomonadota bacterium]MBI3497199.1 glycosyltransferase family 2 protein [Pseudomonadota bacterium]
MDLSVVIPIFNEVESLPPLAEKLSSALRDLRKSYEVIFVDDGSTDGSDKALRRICGADPNLRFISLSRNFGQTAAISAGIDSAKGDILVLMDGDLQNDPADIGLLLNGVAEGFDVVSGWRKDRKDPFLTRRLPSIVANALLSRLTGLRLHDFGCTLKAYRREVLEGVRLYGEMHRFIPVYAHWQGGRVTEVVVTHHRRQQGRSKYGLERIGKVVLDVIVMTFLGHHLVKPIYTFGFAGFLFLALSALIVTAMIVLKLFFGVYMIQTPLPVLAAMMFITGIINLLLGIIAEINIRTYFESQGKKTYSLRTRVNSEDRA